MALEYKLDIISGSKTGPPTSGYSIGDGNWVLSRWIRMLSGKRGMNILEVYNSWDHSEPGGVVMMMRDLMDGLGADHQVTLLINDFAAPSPAADSDRTGRPYYRFRLPAPPRSLLNPRALVGFALRLPVAVIRLNRFYRKHKIDVAHLHYAQASYLTFALARLFGGVPYVITTHRGDIMEIDRARGFPKWAARHALRKAMRVTSVSRWLALETKRVAGLSDDPTVVYNGYAPDQTGHVPRDQLAGALGMPVPAKFAVLVANCRPYKGHDIALKAWLEVRERLPDWRLIMVGGGPDLQDMRGLSTELGLDNVVHFAGPQPRDTTVSLIEAADLLVAPSRNEGQGIIVLEAGFHNTPVVCSDIPPFMEMVEDGVTGFAFRSEDPASLAEAIVRAANSPELASQMAERLLGRVASEFSMPQMIQNYQTVLSGNPD